MLCLVGVVLDSDVLGCGLLGRIGSCCVEEPVSLLHFLLSVSNLFLAYTLAV